MAEDGREQANVGAVAIVTGASSGIGAATVRIMAARGDRVVAVARRAHRLEALATELGSHVLPVAADITVDAQARAVINRAVEHFGGLDVLVNNAGVMLLGPFETNPAADWRRMFELNVLAMMALTQESIPHLRKAAAGPRGVADVVNVGSIAGRTTRATFAVYNASKWAVTAFTDAIRQELATDGIRLSVVQPGAVDTELLDHVDPEVRAAMIGGAFRNVQRATAEDVAATIGVVTAQPPGYAISEAVVRATRQPF